MTTEQEFARYLRVIGKGPNLSRPLGAAGGTRRG